MAAALPDGRLLVAGNSARREQLADFALAQYLADGRLDPSFGAGGLATTDLGGDDRALDLVRQPDGKLLVAGHRNGDLAIVRYLADGTLDADFGSGGQVVIDAGGHDQAAGIAPQPDGRIVLAGTDGTRLLVIRLDAGGTLDAGFGGNGRVAIGFPDGAAAAHAIAVQSDGRLLAAGQAGNSGALVRLLPDGQLDSSFGSGGRVVTALGSNTSWQSVHSRVDGRIVVSGSAQGDLRVMQLAADGSLDMAFGNRGLVSLDGDRSVDTGGVSLVEADGRLLVGGTAAGTSRLQPAVFQLQADGTPDPAFATSGRVLVPLRGSTDNTAQAAVVQPDGQLVVAGSTTRGFRNSRFVLARYAGDGSLDPTFGDQGLVQANLGSGLRVRDVVEQPDGKLLLVGDLGFEGLLLARFTADGELDAGFGSGGRVVTRQTGGERAADAALDSTGRILVAAQSPLNELLLLRYDTAGGLDPTFGAAGVVLADVNASIDRLAGIGVQSDGRIVVAGSTGLGSASDFLAARFLADGSRDLSFGDNGFRVVDAGAVDEAVGLGVLPDERLVLGGRVRDASGQVRFAALRFEADGHADVRFGAGGLSLVDAGTTFQDPRGLAIGPGGDVILVGEVSGAGGSDFGIVRLDGQSAACPASGCVRMSLFAVAVDETEAPVMLSVEREGGTTGAITIDFETADLTAVAGLDYEAASGQVTMDDGQASTMIIINLLPDDLPEGDEQFEVRLVGASGGSVLENPRQTRVTVNGQRGSAGQLDASFGNSGITRTDAGNIFEELWDLAVQSDDRVVAAGNTGLFNSSDFLLARYTSDGFLDPGFGVGGLAKIDFAGDDDVARAARLLPDGRILAVGRATSGLENFGLARLLANGQLDSTFGGNGLGLHQFGGASEAYDLAVLDDGRFLVAGMIGTGEAAVARFLADGDLDTSFGNQGLAVTGELEATISFDQGRLALAVQADGRIVVGGAHGSEELGLVRFSADGVLDLTFGTGGLAVGNAAEFGDDVLYGLLAQPDDKLVVAGATGSVFDYDFLVMRFNADGSPDTMFGQDGAVVIDFLLHDDLAFDVALQADGRLIVAGSANDGDHLTVVRLHTDGMLDTSFGDQGRATVAAPFPANFAGSQGAVVLQGSAIVVGSHRDAQPSSVSQDLFLARVLGDSSPGELRFELAAISADENDGLVSISVRRTGGATGVVTVDYSVSGGTATPGIDFTLDAGTLTFDDGEVLKAFPLVLHDDAQPEGPETVQLVLSNPTGGAALGTLFQTEVTIADGPGRLVFAEAERIAAEDQGEVEIVVLRQGGSDGLVSVVVETIALTATANSDFEPLTETLVFADRQRSATVRLRLLDDTLLEGTETIGLMLRDAQGGATLGSPHTMQLRVFDAEPGLGTNAGSFDGTFGDAGLSTPDAGDLVTVAADVVERAGGGYLLGGSQRIEGRPIQNFLIAGLQDDGTIDRFFGTDGLAQTDFAGGDDQLVQLAVLPDGKFLAAGFTITASGGMDFALARYLANGRLDTSFGTGGRVTTDFAGGLDRLRGLTVQPDGRILLFGSSLDVWRQDLVVARYLPDGMLDTSFGTDGWVRHDLAGTDGEAWDLAVQADGRLVVAVTASFTGAMNLVGLNASGRQVSDFAVLRLESDGQLDTSFGNQGFVRTRFEPDASEAVAEARALIVQPDGHIVAAGVHRGDLALARYLADGSLDTTFGEAGLLVMDDRSGATDIQLQADGMLVVAADEFMLRLDDLGRPDNEFGAGGAADLDAEIGRLAIDSQGRILASIAERQFERRFEAARLLGRSACPAAGCFLLAQAEFSVNENAGSAEITVRRPIDASQLAATVDFLTLPGTALPGEDFTPVSGTLAFQVGQTTASFFVPITDDARDEGPASSPELFTVLLGNPSAGAELGSQVVAAVLIQDNDDTTGGSHGFSASLTNVLENAGSVTITVRRPVASAPATVDFATRDGTAVAGSDYLPALGTLNFATGQLTRTVTIDILADTRLEGSETFTLALSNPTGSAAGSTDLSEGRVTILDIDPSFCVNAGQLDAAFDGDGVATFDVSGQAFQRARTAALQPDGKIVVAGRASADQLALARLNPNGSLDASFGLGGIVRSDFSDRFDEALGVHVLNDGRLLVVGQSLDAGQHQLVLARYTTSGALDSLFGNGGVVRHAVVGRISYTTSLIEFSSDGRVLVGLPMTRPDLPQFALVRFAADGSVDAGFGSFGLALTDVGGGGNATFADLLLQPDGGIVLVGTTDNDAGVFAAVRHVGGGSAGSFRLDVEQLEVNESAGQILVDVRRICGADGPVSVNLQTTGGTAAAGVDFSPVNMTVDFADRQLTRTIAIAILDNQSADGDRSFGVELAMPTSGATLNLPDQATVTIVDDEQPGTVQFSSLEYFAAESDAATMVAFERTGGSAGAVSASLRVVGGTAMAGVDFDAVPLSVTWLDGQNVSLVAIPLLDDDVVDGDKTLELELEAPTGGAVLGFRVRARLTIADDELPPVEQGGTFEFGAEEFVVSESGGYAALTVRRGTGADAVASVRITTVDQTASSPADYAGLDTTLVFAAGEVEKLVLVPVFDDELREGTERALIQLSSPSDNAALGPQATATLTILDDEPLRQGWQNPENRLDVSGDRIVAPNDVLAVVNELNQPAFSDRQTRMFPVPTMLLGPPPFLDVNGDNLSSPVDALIIINFINSRGAGEGEVAAKPFVVVVPELSPPPPGAPTPRTARLAAESRVAVALPRPIPNDLTQVDPARSRARILDSMRRQLDDSPEFTDSTDATAALEGDHE